MSTRDSILWDSLLHPHPYRRRDDHAPVTRPPRSPRLAAFAGAVALSAWAGVVGLVGGGLALPTRLVERLPFDSLTFGGVALALVVAVPTTVTAVLAWRGSGRTPEVAEVAGALTIGWILVQLAFLRELSFFHPLYLAVGAALVVAGRDVARRPAARGRGNR